MFFLEIILVVSIKIYTFANENNKNRDMNTTTFQITVPTADVSMLKKLIAGMGWSMSTLTKRKKAGIKSGLEDIEKGRLYHAENSEDLVKQIFG